MANSSKNLNNSNHTKIFCLPPKIKKNSKSQNQKTLRKINKNWNICTYTYHMCKHENSKIIYLIFFNTTA